VGIIHHYARSSISFSLHKSSADSIDLDVTILGELGSLTQFVGGPRYDEFCKGLRSLIADLPKDKRKDFDVVAQALLEYRAKFLADASKVLPLEGVSV